MQGALPLFTQDGFARLVSALLEKPKLQDYAALPGISGEMESTPLFASGRFAVSACCRATESGFTYDLRRFHGPNGARTEIAEGFTAYREEAGYRLDVSASQLVAEAEMVKALKRENGIFRLNKGAARECERYYAAMSFERMLQQICMAARPSSKVVYLRPAARR